MWHHEFEELIKIHKLNVQGSYHPDAARHQNLYLQQIFNFFLDSRTIHIVLKTTSMLCWSTHVIKQLF